jgi:nicotinamidase-related amidase
VLERGSWSATVVDELTADPSDIQSRHTGCPAFRTPSSTTSCATLMSATLMFAGLNADQCVLCILLDTNLRGYDCLFLEDYAATPSPDYCLAATIYNVRQSLGLSSDRTPSR